MKMHRPGHILGNRGEELKIGLNRLISPRANHLNADIVVTVNELTSLGDIRLGIHTPFLLSVGAPVERDVRKKYLNRLCLSRAVGTSVVIRKKDGILDVDAVCDLKENGIYISNATSSLYKTGRKTGASLIFYANESIWKVIRLELTLLRGTN